MEAKKITTRCCIAGGGPAGIMLGYFLGRAGIKTVVLEKWPDFFRDFRGDTIHPSTMEVLHEASLLEKFLALPHNRVYKIEGEIGSHKVVIADFSKIKALCPFIAFIPQWDFLNFITEEAQNYGDFNLLMKTEVRELIEKEGKIIGLQAKNDEGDLEVYADLIIGADGRHSSVRKKSGLIVQDLSAPMDVLWFRLSKRSHDQRQLLGKIDTGKMMVMIDRGNYWQCGFIIKKGDFDKFLKKGLLSFYNSIIELAPDMADRVNEIQSFEDVKLLEVKVNRMPKWYKDGLICIGDAAHAMSPIGGVGINLAIQDAIACANILIPAFLNGTPTLHTLATIQKRRELPTRIIQGVQVFMQNNLIARILGNPNRIQVPFLIKLLQQFPVLQRIPAYLVAFGFRREHVKIS